jgi:glycine betaine/choline ABC-type transport system substrate-binding protein
VAASSSDPENVLLANIYAAGLRYYGTAARVDVLDDPLSALDTGQATVAAGLTGALLERFDPGSAARSPESVYRAMIGALPEGIAAADYAVAAEDKPALTVTESTATAWGGRDLGALVRNCGSVSVGARTGFAAPTAVGDCTLPPVRGFGSDGALFDALRGGGVTAAWTTTADTDIPGGLIVLVDRKPTLIGSRNVVALYRRNELNTMQLRAVNEIAGVLDTASLTDMLRTVQGGADPQAVAEEWLNANPLGR